MYAGKPIIGIVGGIGSGKSFVARLFGECGCHVIDSDSQVRAAYGDPAIVRTLRSWWGESVTGADGQTDRVFIGKKVFGDAEERLRLEGLIHPWVNFARLKEMESRVADTSVVAFVWDTPLLFEAGLAGACDCVVFVDAPLQTRLWRVRQTRGWEPEELFKRENLQWPLDKKRELSDHVLSNAADAAQARDQVRGLLPLILAQVAPC